MLRAIAAVIVGYVAIVIVVSLSFVGAWTALGVETVFQPGSYHPSGAWIAVSIVLGLVGAVIGGFICALIATSAKPVQALAGLVLIVGLVMAVLVLVGGDARPTERPADVDMQTATQNAIQPAWVAFLNPLVGAVGVLLGGRLKRRN